MGPRHHLLQNYIAENLSSQVDIEGNRHVLFEDIIDNINYRSEVKQQDAFITAKHFNKRQWETMKGWEIFV